jgi:hypothetical protein
MHHFADATSQTAANFPQRLRFAQLTKKHAHEMCPRTETLAMFIVAVLLNDALKIVTIKMCYNLGKEIRTFRMHFDLRFVDTLAFAQT